MSSLSGIRNHNISAATKLRRIIESPNGYVFAPGVYDGLSARTALEVGFDCLYMVRLPIHLGIESLTLLTTNFSLLQTGAGTTASRIGHADLAIASLPGNNSRCHVRSRCGY
jgi:methylisocitrate lyase